MQVCFLSCCNILSRKHCETLCQVTKKKKKNLKKNLLQNIDNRTNSLSSLWVTLQDHHPVLGLFSFLRYFIPGADDWKEKRCLQSFHPQKKTARLCEFVSVCIWSKGSDDLYLFLFFRFVYECSIHWIYWEHVFFCCFFFLWIICWDGGGLGWFIRFDSYF